MARERILISLDAETARLLDTLTTPRKKGQFVDRLIRQAAEDEPVTLILQRLEERLKKIEAKLDRLNAKGSSLPKP